MPYITAQFMTRKIGDRPMPVAKGATNLGMTSQFVEIPGDVVFTVEYSVRSAQMAVYELLNITKQIPPISHHEDELPVKLKCVKKAFAGTCWTQILLVVVAILVLRVLFAILF
jgi:oleate hydratase